MADLKSYPVWDAGTRWFHWINVLCVLALMGVGLVILNASSLDVSNAGKIKIKTIHAWIGYVFCINLIWRFIWAFLGNRYAKLRAVLPGGKGYFHALRNYVVAFFSGHPEQYIGHNPVRTTGSRRAVSPDHPSGSHGVGAGGHRFISPAFRALDSAVGGCTGYRARYGSPLCTGHV